MTVFERQNKIFAYLKEQGFATVKELSRVVWSSESSVRRDLRSLEDRGYLKQIYGGVVLSEYANGVVPIALRDSYNTSVKEELARRAAAHLFDGATVLMDGSSTVRRMVKYMGNFNHIKIITNNQRMFGELLSPKITLYCTGGRYLAENNIFAGSAAERFLEDIHADLLFFSSQAISEEGEVTDASEEETSLRRVMLARAKTKIFVCDSSKIGAKKLFSVCTKEQIDHIICDKRLPWE